MDADVPDSGYTSRTTYDTTDITSIISPGAEPKLTHYREINEYGAVDDGAGYYSNIDYSEPFVTATEGISVTQVMDMKGNEVQNAESFQEQLKSAQGPLTASGTTLQTDAAVVDPLENAPFQSCRSGTSEQFLEMDESYVRRSAQIATALSVVKHDESESGTRSQSATPATGSASVSRDTTNSIAPQKITIETAEINLPAHRSRLTDLPVAPADLFKTKDPMPAFKFMGQKNVQWFSLRQQVTGSIDAVVTFLQKEILENPQYCTFSVTNISNVKQHKYSILEALPSNYTQMEYYGFPDASPSLRASTHIPPILKSKATTSIVFNYITLIILQAFIWTPLICTLIPSLKAQTHIFISTATLAILVEVLLFIVASGYSNSQMQTTSTDIQSLVFDASCLMASSLPRQMPSECGHSKYLRRQRISPGTYKSLVITLGAITFFLLLYPVSLSMHSFFPPIYQIFPESWAPYITMLIAALGLSTFFPASFLYTHCRIVEQSIRQSICCNLRGFYPSNVFALDYSSIHNIDEGLCYFFGNKTPNLFIPFIAIDSVALIMEPVDVRLRYRFTRKEIALFDGRHNAKALDVARRGYDVLEEKDLLIWVVLGLSNDLKLWLPLSMTQWNPCLFGFQGSEVATLLELAASAIDLENKNLGSNEEEKPKAHLLQDALRNAADFCRFYQESRRETVMEEALHIPRISSFIVPTEV